MRLLCLPAVFLLLAPAARAADPVKITKGQDALELHAGTELVAKYQFAGTVPKEKGDGTKPLAKPFFYPLNAPGGAPVTARLAAGAGEARRDDRPRPPEVGVVLPRRRDPGGGRR